MPSIKSTVQARSDFEETDTRFAIGWKGEYRIDGNAFVYLDRDSGRVVTILGYPVRRRDGKSELMINLALMGVRPTNYRATSFRFNRSFCNSAPLMM